MRSRNFIAVFALAAVAACAPLGIKTEAQKIATACATASASLKVLAAAAELGKLTPQAQGGVIAAVGVISPICGAEQAPTLDDVKREAFLAAITALQLAATQAQAEVTR
jgi:hypothetical protein